MKNTLKSIFGISAICLIAFASCKKKEDDSTKSRLTGKWKWTQYATDDNNNGIRDASELIQVNDTGVVFLYFNDNGSGLETFSDVGITDTIPFTWALENGDKDIRLISTMNTANPAGTLTHIEALSGSEMILKDTATSVAGIVNSWNIFKKQ
jgi:hypothetical protein